MSQVATTRNRYSRHSKACLPAFIMEFAAPRLCESAADSLDIDTISVYERKKKKEKVERHREGGEGGGKERSDAGVSTGR